ncbi:hypothetical protein N9217_01475 [Akkermansiaceae bacterium]|nr:hypothetical protein [Akkermansiaceae bacterium]
MKLPGAYDVVDQRRTFINESGYIFALNYFMVSTNERTKKYQGFITSIRAGAKPTKDLLLKTMGYGDDASFEKDWYEWMMSSKFK